MTDLAALLLTDGYRAIELDRRRRGGGPTYASRMLGRRAVVVGKAAGARLFYDEDVVERAGAVPPPLAWLLFGRGAVHGLDDGDHRRRKQLFLDELTPARITGCVADAGVRLQLALADRGGARIAVHDELVAAYGPAVLAWAGVDVDEQEARRLSRTYAAIVDGFGFGFAGAAYLRGWRARLATDAWARRLVGRARAGRERVRPGTVLAALVASDLDDRVAGVELGNVLRPTIAVSWLSAFAALALTQAPDWCAPLAEPDADRLRWSFAQEVRRTTPFVPALAGRLRADAVLDGVELRRGEHVVLDVRGINLDPERYDEPDRVRPDRFVDREPGPFELVPQCGGLPLGHRCPGESMTLRLLVETTRVLARAGVRADPPGRPRVGLSRIPTLPEGRMTVVTGGA